MWNREAPPEPDPKGWSAIIARSTMSSRAEQWRAGGCDHSVSRKMSRKADLVPSQFDAVAFDLDGVVTDTARIHFRAWKQTFDAFFEARSRREGVAPAPFTLEDYRKYIDGRPREDAIRTFLTTRGAQIPEGDESDGAKAETVNGLAECKDGPFLPVMRR